MKNIVNFDNAAGSYPKPPEVKRAVMFAMDNYGGNAGRGGHILSVRTSEMVFDTRQTVASMFDSEPENVIFCSNCTLALNMAIKGIVKRGGHIITSSIEHNSVMRPITSLASAGYITFDVAEIHDSDDMIVSSFESLINDRTQAIVCTAAGNVDGRIMPVRKLGKLCAERKICFIVDGAQACGIIPLSLKEDMINILCTSGQKGLYGIAGSGLLISDGKYKITPIIQGGTGSASQSLVQQDFMPDCLESGTLGTIGIASLKAGIKFINNISLDVIQKHEQKMTDIFMTSMQNEKDIIIYRKPDVKYLPLLSFNVRNIPSEEFASYLNKKGFCLRAGLHCSAMAHKYLKTETGTVRFAPSVFSNEKDVKNLCYTIKNAL